MQWQVPMLNGPFTMADLANDGVMTQLFHVHTVIATDVEEAGVKAQQEHEAECLVNVSKRK